MFSFFSVSFMMFKKSGALKIKIKKKTVDDV